MKDFIRRSMIRTSIMFTLIILYCIVSMIIKFNLLDLSYLTVVVVCFALYLKKVLKLL